MVRWKLNGWVGNGPHRVTGDGDVMAIHTGLSATVCGHVIELDRDEHRRVATVVVRAKPGQSVVRTALEESAITVAAELLARRARRFLGAQWTVVEWRGDGQCLRAGA